MDRIAQIIHIKESKFEKDIISELRELKTKGYDIFFSTKRSGLPESLLIIGEFGMPIKNDVYEILNNHGIDGIFGEAYLLQS